MDADILRRDGGCVACGKLAGCRVHHRILGNRDDDRASNRIVMCGWGNVPPGHHGAAHQRGRLARDYGYIVTRHGPRTATLTVPVFYHQPAAGIVPGRIGWFVLDDDGRLTPVDLPLLERFPDD